MKTPRDFSFCLIMVYLVICEFLPIVKVINPIILSGGKIIAVVFFIFFLLRRNKELGIKFTLILLVVLAVSTWAFYQCWKYYTTPGSFIMTNVLCFVYMEMGVYLALYTSKATRTAIRNILLVIVCITAITSIISIQSVPFAMRELGNGSKSISGLETSLYLRNTSTWGEVYAMVFILPSLILWYKQIKKMGVLMIIVLLEACILLSQITTAIIISFSFLPLLILKAPSLKRLFFLGAIFIGFMFFLSNYAGLFFYWLHEVMSKTGNEMLALRSHQLYLLFSAQKMTGTISGRYDLYLTSLETFFKNPILGYEFSSAMEFNFIGLHSQIFDFMAAMGLIIFIPYVLAYASVVKSMIKCIRDDNQYRYFLLSIIMLILLMFTNPTYYACGIYMSAFMAPSLFLLR